MNTIRVAAIQSRSHNGAIEANLAHAETLVEDAAAQGAELVLCPEFLAAGYIYDESIWRSAEPAGGPTETWLERVATQHGLYLGAGFLEAEGEDFYNTFSLYGPDGTRHGRVRKASLPMFEGWYFTPCSGPKVIHTPLGKLGVGICNDNQTASFLRHMFDERPDLLLMPHSAPTPALPGSGWPYRQVYDTQLAEVPVRFARALGVPTVMANKAQRGTTSTPIPLLPGVRIPLAFHGHSAICDGRGEVLERLVGEEGVLVADVSLDPALHTERVPVPRGYWSFAPNVLPRATGWFLYALAALGRRSYRRNPRRSAAAHAAACRQRSST